MKTVLASFKGDRSELIPILQKTQRRYGYLSKARLATIAEFLGLSESAVYGVVTFYSQFHLARQGRNKITICQGTACHVRGGTSVMRSLKKRLGIEPGETTSDYEFTLERVACLGSCALAPVVVANGKVYGEMDDAKIDALIKELKRTSTKKNARGAARRSSPRTGRKAPKRLAQGKNR